MTLILKKINKMQLYFFNCCIIINESMNETLDLKFFYLKLLSLRYFFFR